MGKHLEILSLGFFFKNRKAQVWVETVIYTLIAFVIIGLILLFVKPKIEEIQDKALIEQSIGVLKDLDATFLDITQGGVGNKRLLEIRVKKGILRISAEENEISFEIESRYVYSQPGKNVSYDGIVVLTEEKGKINKVTLTKDYAGKYDISLFNNQIQKSLNKAPTPYKTFITNKGGEIPIMEIEVQ